MSRGGWFEAPRCHGFNRFDTHTKYSGGQMRRFRNDSITSSNRRKRMRTIRARLRAAVLMGVTSSALVFASGVKAQSLSSNDWQPGDPWGIGSRSPSDNTWPYAPVGRSPVLAVVGDVACQPGEEE